MNRKMKIAALVVNDLTVAFDIIGHPIVLKKFKLTARHLAHEQYMKYSQNLRK